MLNYLVGTNFSVSAGCHTKGINATLFSTDVPGTREMLILDTERLFGIDTKFDRRLSAFCITNSNLVLFNIKGVLDSDVTDLLESVVYTLGREPTLNMC